MGDAGSFLWEDEPAATQGEIHGPCVGHHTKMGSSSASGDLSWRGQHKQMLQIHNGQLNTVGLACDRQHWCLYLDKIKKSVGV